MMGFMGMWYGWILVIAIIAAAVYLVSNINKNKDTEFTKNPDAPLDILKKRLARGEITAKEYNELKNEFTK